MIFGKWFAIIGGIVFTTVHLQDLYDQDGDALRGRRTLPLVIGDLPTRWLIAAVMPIWGLACPLFWRATAIGWIFSVSLGVTVVVRTLMMRTTESDKSIFIVWNMWMTTVYLLPMFSSTDLVPQRRSP